MWFARNLHQTRSNWGFLDILDKAKHFHHRLCETRILNLELNVNPLKPSPYAQAWITGMWHFRNRFWPTGVAPPLFFLVSEISEISTLLRLHTFFIGKKYRLVQSTDLHWWDMKLTQFIHCISDFNYPLIYHMFVIEIWELRGYKKKGFWLINGCEPC